MFRQFATVKRRHSNDSRHTDDQACNNGAQPHRLTAVSVDGNSTAAASVRSKVEQRAVDYVQVDVGFGWR